MANENATFLLLFSRGSDAQRERSKAVRLHLDENLISHSWSPGLP
ncbi:MAG TPA: hypothetical protein VFV38_48735 [Ktedonobacteraceae bacterium]|nr:hypothetical protein [Ktedonobacteraceae bacterium]